tara:strand:- start:1043 stop:1363 length:321 start_codon:yes stop_codon:yes gene_type:complete
MNHIERPLSILLIVTAIAYTFMYADSDGFTPIENNTSPGYKVEAAELTSGYNINKSNYNAEELEGHTENLELIVVDSLYQWALENVDEVDSPTIQLKRTLDILDEE